MCPAGRGGRRAGPCYEDRRQPLAPALAGRGAPDDHGAEPIPAEQLPRDAQGRLLRPGGAAQLAGCQRCLFVGCAVPGKLLF